MKRTVILTMVMVVVVMGISDKAVADVWSRCGLLSSHGFRYGGRRFLGGSFRTPYGNVWNRCGLSSSYGGYGYGRDRTLGRVTGYGGLAMNVLGGLNQISTTNRLVNHQISTDNRMINMTEREQAFRHQQTGPIVLQVKRPKTQKNENQELRKEVEALKLELEKLKLQQELEKAKK